MCTVVIHVPEDAAGPVRLLAVRDEDPARPWRPLGRWWPDQPDVVGVQDVRAGGAWLAADVARRRLAVLLNRRGGEALPDAAVVSRGTLALESVAGRSPGERPPMRGFNLLEVDATSARVVSWDGAQRRVTPIGPGTHMIAHDEVDDPATARISHWLEHFRLAGPGEGEQWYAPWLAVVERSAELGRFDDRAIIRDNTPLGYPTLSLLVCAASVGRDGVELRSAPLPVPGQWSPLRLR
ncbi:NRDE family protein [Microbacterium sp. SORGH_AS_0888]|uniref:NRDE family protein n=1 Tax=Microbacterium sp. SORGH_AS_0888 TaxID=3041791 RepID=UPI00278494DD|nr:NRDE family protein [Microbacterium sp. SORGH_AS_0888]MDQ1129434.1 hypothetical protein [Microbacterium sp. SORGH_AS_0888]